MLLARLQRPQSLLRAWMSRCFSSGSSYAEARRPPPSGFRDHRQAGTSASFRKDVALEQRHGEGPHVYPPASPVRQPGTQAPNDESKQSATDTADATTLTTGGEHTSTYGPERPLFRSTPSSLVHRTWRRKNRIDMRLPHSEKPKRLSESPGEDMPTAPKAPFRPKQKPSLYDELFPERVTAQEPPRSSPSSRDPHRITYHVPEATPKLDHHKQNSKPAFSNHESRDTAVLFLSNASKTLQPSDFHRLAPKGNHIEGWLSGILKIIPGRDLRTLAPLGHYYILFSSDEAARTYAATVRRMHSIAHAHAETRIDSPLAPAPGQLRNGEDIGRILQEFTLVPASAEHVRIPAIKRPYTESIKRLAKLGGHDTLVALQAYEGCEALVLLAFHNGSEFNYVHAHQIRRWLALDGRRRGVPWGLVDGGTTGAEIMRLDAEGRILDAEGREVDLEGTAGRGVPAGTKPARDAATTRTRNTYKDKAATAKRSRRLPSRLVLRFADAMEARRFVRQWHCRPFYLGTTRSVGVTIGAGTGTGAGRVPGTEVGNVNSDGNSGSQNADTGFVDEEVPLMISAELIW